TAGVPDPSSRIRVFVPLTSMNRSCGMCPLLPGSGAPGRPVPALTLAARRPRGQSVRSNQRDPAIAAPHPADVCCRQARSPLSDEGTQMTDVPHGFAHTHPRCRIFYRAGGHRQLPQLLAEAGARSVFVVCGRTVGAGPQLAALRAVLGSAVVGVFDGVRPHGGAQHLASAAEQLDRSGADAVVSVGGGAAIDTAKYLILLLSATADLHEYE